MHVEAIKSIHGYSDWATGKVLDCCEKITPEQFTDDAGLPWGSLRDQLIHTFIAHKRWLCWADGSMDGEEAYALQAEPEDYPDIVSVREMWTEVQRQNQRFLDRMTSADLNRELRVEWPGFEFAIRVEQVMIHIAHHSMQHRTEAAMELSRLGASPGDVDYLFYALEQHG